MRPAGRLSLYVLGVCLLGFPTGVWLLAQSAAHLPTVPWLLTAVLVSAIVWGELAPVKLTRNGAHAGSTSLANSFALALLTVAPPGIALLAIALPSAIDSLVRRAQWYRVCFNAALTALLVAASRCVFSVVSGDHYFSSPTITGHHVWAVLAMGVTFFAVNEALLAPAISYSSGGTLWRTFRDNAGDHLFPMLVEVSCAILALAVASVFAPLSLAFLLPSALAVWRSTKLAAERERAAWHDSITGLPNLQLLRQMYLRRREEAEPGAERLAVLLVDLEGLKGVQHALGDDAAVLLLAETARRLERNVRAGDVVARRTDDFAVMAPLEGPEAHGDLEQLARRLLHCLNEPFYLDDVRVDVQATIGAVVTETAEEDLDLLVRRAGLALQAARDDSPGTLRLHTSDMDVDEVSTREQLSLLGELREAIESGHIELHYQPKANVADGMVTGVEALVRWRHPVRGMIFPDQFLPLAEHTGLIEPLTWEVLDQAVAQAKEWQARSWALGVAVNFAAAQIIREDSVDHIVTILSQHQLEPQYLTVEITEGTLVGDTKKAFRVLEKLRWLGVRVSIDDYGTGHSSLAYLHELHPDELKIDRCFVKDLATEDAGAAPAIVESTVDLAKRLGVKVVAEGAEDAETVEVLQRLGCDVVQGYYYSRPLPAAALTDWLDRQLVATAQFPRQRSGSALRPHSTSAR